MFWNIVIGILSYAIQLALTPKPPNAKPKSLEDFQAPTAEEGREIPVVFGTADIADPNVTWYGDLKRKAIKGARRYGLFGPRQILGYKYSLGMQMGLCHGPADALYRITVGDKLAWKGVSGGGQITINKSSLFGGDKSEGGISGTIDLNMGAPDQLQDDYLASKLGATISAFRGIVTVVLRQVYLGTSNYIKPWEFRLQRIHLKSDGTTQWYDAKAAIPAYEISTDETGVDLGSSSLSSPGDLDTNGDYVAWSTGDGETIRVATLPDGSGLQTVSLSAPFSTGGGLRITDFGELVVRTGGNGTGTVPTTLEFRDVANADSILQSINLQPLIEGNGGIDLNRGFVMDDVSVGGSSYALVFAYGFGGSVAILLQRSSGAWTIINTDSPPATLAASVVMGPTYAYCRGASSADLARITWNGTWVIDTITLPDYSGLDVRDLFYSAATHEVVVIDAFGAIFVFNEDLSEMLRTSSAFSSIGGSIGGLLPGKRALTNAGSFVVCRKLTGPNVITHIYTIQISDLTAVSDITLSSTNYLGKSLTSFQQTAYNPDHGGLTLLSSSRAYFWPITATVFDMNPAHIIRECLTDATWGMGYNDADIDDTSFTACADTFFTELFGLSLRWSQEEEIQEFVSTILSHVDAYLYVSRSTGKFVLKAIRNDYDIDLIPVLTEDDVVEWTEIDHRSPAEAVSSVLVKFYYREKRKNGAHLVTNIAQAMQATKVQPATREYPGINRSDLAIKVATRDVIALGSGLTSGRLIAKRTIEGMNPGDPFRLVSARHRLSGEVMRVADLNFGDGRQNKIGLKFLPDVFNLGAAVLVDDTDSPWVPPSSDPLAVSPRLVWEMPYREMRQMVGDADLATMLSGDPDAGIIQVAGSSPTSDALNADIDVDAGSGYEFAEAMEFAPGAFLAADLAIDGTSVTVSGFIDSDDAAAGMLATIDGLEVVRIDAIAGNTLTISRGMLDTVPQAHSSGASLVLFDDFSMSDFTVKTAGDVVSVKLLTNTGNGQLALGAAPTDTVTFGSRPIRPLRPADGKLNTDPYGPLDATALDPIPATWANRNRLTELDDLPAWTDADETPEASQTTTLHLTDEYGAIVHSYTGLSGTSYDIDPADFGALAGGYVVFDAERDGYTAWQTHRIRVLLGSRLLLSGDEQSGIDHFLFSGDEAPGTLVL